MSKEVAPVMALTPFLTVPQVAAQLGIPDIAVLRLLARGALPGNQLPDGDWKILPDALENYATRGLPDFAMPRIDDEWFDRLSTIAAADQLVKGVQGWLEKRIPKVLPLDPKTKKPLTIYTLTTDDFLRAIITAPVTSETALLKMANTTGPKPEVFPNRLMGYAAHQMRVYAQKHCVPKPADLLVNPNAQPRLSMLYASPADYQSIAADAWRRFMLQDIFVLQVYPIPGGDSARLRINVRVEQLGINQKEVIKLAF